MSLTCVSCFWKVDNKHGDRYFEWFKNSLRVNCPYVFFSDKEGIEIIKKYRENLPTFYIECEIKDFYTFKYKNVVRTNPRHCPSVELNLIWNEKIFLLQKAYDLNPFQSDWFKWIDAGICVYRDTPPPVTNLHTINILNSLPKDKFIYSSSTQYIPNLVSTTNYYHHISGTFILHKNIINQFVEIYKLYLDKLWDKNNIWTEQVIYTHIYKDYPSLFFKLCDGYGSILTYLYDTQL